MPRQVEVGLTTNLRGSLYKVIIYGVSRRLNEGLVLGLRD